MADRVFRVALTGGIATGKSHCLRQFAALGVPVIDADVIAHAALAPGTAGLDEVRRHFGSRVIKDGALDRPALGAIVFADAKARQALEAIVHPLVYAAIGAWFTDPAGAERADLAIADIPLLYETGHAGDFDRVVVAACSARTQLARVMTRDNLSEEEAARRIASQRPIEEKRRLAHYVIQTEGSLAQTDAAVAEVLQQLKTDASGARRAAQRS
jgi:dephospho-CoA kinase